MNSICLIYGGFFDNSVTQVIFSYNSVVFGGYNLCLVAIFIVTIASDGIFFLFSLGGKSAVEFLFFLDKPTCSVVPIPHNLTYLLRNTLFFIHQLALYIVPETIHCSQSVLYSDSPVSFVIVEL